jgi:Protein of unknown function (DUF1552)
MLFGYRPRLDRRTFLRAGAVSVALPLLDSMLPTGRAAKFAASPAKRLVILQRPLGTYAPYFFPETPGPQYEATRFLKLIDAHRGQFTVFSGMSHLGYPNDHRTEFALLSGVHPDMIKRMDDMHNTISLDQEVADAVGRHTRVPYLLLGPMHDGLSSSRKGVSLPGNTRRAEVFAQLFVNGTPDEVAREIRRLQDGKSILDGVRDQLRRLERESGSVDRRRLDVLATSIREAEQSLTQDEEWATKPKPNVGDKPDSDANEWVGHTRQWFDLIHLAVQTDSTRVIVHRIPEQPAAPTAPGTQIGEHDASHHGKEPRKIEQVAAFEDAHFKLLDHLLKKLRDSAERDGTLLDNTQVLFLSNMGDGSAHASNNLPILLAGGGYQHPGHVAFDRSKNYPLSNLYLRMLRQMGIEKESFGSSTGMLTEIG